MVDELEDAILDAWNRVKSKVLTDPLEQRKRLARRRCRTFTRPPRAWCIAIRAHDRRLVAPLVTVDPDTALHPAYHDGRVVPHTVTVTSASLRVICEPVHLFGRTIHEAAAKLGTHRGNLLHSRINGTLRARYVEGLGGHWGHPVPLLSADEPLDPTTRGYATAHAAWDWTGDVACRVPDGIEHTIRRVPHEQRRGPSYRDTAALHPEHPDVDGRPYVPRKRLQPPPTQDLCTWYKWKGEEYIGYDWRNPYARAGHERRDRERAARRKAARERYRNKHRPSTARGSLEFRGWRWLCPRCGRRVSILYHPLPHVNLLGNWPSACDELAAAGIELLPPPPAAGFACAPCHRLLRCSPGTANFWNHVVTYLSGGLLYGSEVRRPAWLTFERKRPYRARPNGNGRPALRRDAVEKRLVKGWTYQRIAADMGISPGTIDMHARHIYRQHNVHNRRQLAHKLGVTTCPPTMREQIRERLTNGQRYRDIAKAIGSSHAYVRNYASQWRRGMADAKKKRKDQSSKSGERASVG